MVMNFAAAGFARLRGQGGLMRTTLLIPAALLAATMTLPAQERWRAPSVEVRPFAGAYIPVGAQRSDFKSATMAGLQGAIELNRHFHALASVGWTHGHNKIYTRDVTHIWQYDLGAEFNLVRDLGYGWYFRPFIGTGAGGRTYDYRRVGIETKSCLAGYGTAGTEFQYGVVAFRMEARDYLSCFERPTTGRKQTRNDLGLTFGLAYHLR
jgi:hypothetical protein